VFSLTGFVGITIHKTIKVMPHVVYHKLIDKLD